MQNKNRSMAELGFSAEDIEGKLNKRILMLQEHLDTALDDMRYWRSLVDTFDDAGNGLIDLIAERNQLTKEFNDEREKNKCLCGALRLLNCMLESGGCHSNQSRKVIAEALGVTRKENGI